MQEAKGAWQKDTGWKKDKGDAVDKSGAKHSAMSRVKHLAKMASRKVSEDVEQIDEISKETAQSYLKKTVDPVEGMPRPGFKNLKTRMKGIERASKIVTKPESKPQQKNQHMRNVLQQRAKARELVQNLADQLRRKKEKEDQ